MPRFREPVSGLTHLGGAIVFLVALLWLLGYTPQDSAERLTVLIFGLSTIAMFMSSAILHLYNGHSRTIFWLRRVDHASIYLVIAGTYTPMAYHFLDDPARWIVLGLVWVMAIVGVIYKMLFLHGRSHLSTLYYLIMGWLVLPFAPQIIEALPLETMVFIIAGGLVYSAGSIVFMLERPNFHHHFGFHELWHLFVLAGCALHFAAITSFVV